MKTQLKLLLLLALFAGILFPQRLHAQASTEGSDFWVTFLQADQDNNNNLQLELTITSRHDCEVTIENIYTTYSEKVQVKANISTTVRLYDGDVRATQARNDMNSTGKVCYAVNSEQADNCALHVTAKDANNKPVDISLFASTYKKATFDATNVLPTASLRDDYIIQTYTPSDHGGVSSTQGSHFAIIAAEDNVVVDYWPTVATTGHAANTMVTTPTLQKGQVWYVWTGKKDSVAGDLSGTKVKARDNKKIAVFQGCPHTNIPYQIKQRDHIFSQAMPTIYWGSNFVLTASKDRKKDIIRVLALYDNTDVFINDEKVHTFNFNSTDPKQYWEFIIGENGWYAEDGSCYLTTSCPCAVHLFIASQNFDGVSNGDPAMLWVNPIEQRIDQITFATYNSLNGTTEHYTNIVTDKPKLITLDGDSIENEFKMVNGNSKYYYAQVSLGNAATSHTLKSDGGYFIAHVYGFTDNESYGYSAGSATVGREIQINSVSFRSDDDNNRIKNAPTFCINDTLDFVPLNSDGSIYQVLWDFGDGTSTFKSKKIDEDIELLKISHEYTSPGWYDAKAILYGEEHCTHPAFTDTILTTFRVVRPDTLDETIVLCASDFPYTFMGKTFNMKDKNVDEVIKDTVQDDDCSNVYRLTIQALGQKNTDIDLDTVYTQEQRQDRALIPGDDRGNSPEYVYTSGTYTRTYNRKNSTCDSVVNYSVTIIKCLDFKVDEDNPKKEYTACRNESADIPYSHDRDGNAGRAFFEFTIGDSRDTIPVTLTQLKDDGISRVSGSIDLPLTNIVPGHYQGVIKVLDLNCNNNDGTPQYAVSDTITISVLYPSDIFKAKFGNSLSVYNPGYGGNKIDPDKKDGDANNGWKFIAYQWYKDDQKIDSLTAQDPLYYTPYNEEGRHIKLEGVYYVELTREDGVKLKSCSQTFIDGKHPETKPAPAAQDEEQNDSASSNTAQKILQNRQIRILRDGHTYNIYGQKVD